MFQCILNTLRKKNIFVTLFLISYKLANTMVYRIIKGFINIYLIHMYENTLK